MRYHIITYGCQMNKSDSERIAASLKREGYKPASKMEKADMIVVNMCSVRQSAVDRIFGVSQKLLRMDGQTKPKTVLTGCILKKDKIKFRKIFDEIWEQPKKCAAPSKFIPISNGCDNFCTYCVVPHTRGALICRGHKEILKEIKNSVKNGFKEIWLLGQNVNDYKSKSENKNSKIINFAGLVEMVDNIPGNFKFFFTSPHPKNFSGELISVLAKCRKFGGRLNLPVQSGDNQILKKMNRPYTVGQYKNLVRRIRKAIPNINLSTDVIVGFPGETKKQFENTLKLFKKIKFDIAYIAKYSQRQGTAASLMEDNVPLEEKKRREKILMKILNANK